MSLGILKDQGDKNKHLTIQVKKLYRFIEEQFRDAPIWRAYGSEYRTYYSNKQNRESDLDEI